MPEKSAGAFPSTFSIISEEVKMAGTKWGYCSHCQMDTEFEHHVVYNFGDPAMGVQTEYWMCMGCREHFDTSPLPPKDK